MALLRWQPDGKAFDLKRNAKAHRWNFGFGNSVLAPVFRTGCGGWIECTIVDQ